MSGTVGNIRDPARNKTDRNPGLPGAYIPVQETENRVR